MKKMKDAWRKELKWLACVRMIHKEDAEAGSPKHQGAHPGEEDLA